MQREIEAAGITTVSLSPIAELTGSVGAPRVAAVEHPLGRVLGRPGDAKGQREVLLAALRVAESAERPGAVAHLPFTWPDPPARVRSAAAEPPPISTLLRRKPWLMPRLFHRNPPS